MADYIMALDAGTTSSRCILFNKIGIDHKAGFLAESICKAFGFQRVTIIRGPAALPYNRVEYGFSCMPVPYDRGLSLIGNADGGNVCC